MERDVTWMQRDFIYVREREILFLLGEIVSVYNIGRVWLCLERLYLCIGL